MQKKIMSAIFLVLCSPFYASAKNFSVDLIVAAGESDNALKQRDNEIDEQQNRYTASVQGLWDKSWVDASMEYTAYKETFADDSQNGENYLQGDSALKFGNANNLFNLDLRHSRRTLLKEIGDTPLAVNQEERDIFSVMPSANIDISANDELVVFADLTRTRYLESRLRNSERNSYGVDHQHDFSSTDKINVRFKRTKSEFTYFPEVDYVLESAAIVYAVNLRQISYSVGLGQDNSETEVGGKYTSPHYEASLNYKSGFNEIRLYIDESVTDSSYGQGMEFIISDLTGIDTASGQLELIERRTSGIDFTSSGLCARCNLIVGVNHARDKYLDTDEVASRLGISTSFNYRLSERASVLLAHSISDQKPLVSQTVGDYRQSFSRIAIRYQPIRNFSVDIFAEKEKRSSDISLQDYTENFIGLAIGYHFE
jgi:hypothetical protein